MSQNSPEDLSVKMVFELLSSYFRDTYDGLLNVLHEEPNYKRLLKTGEQQFFDAANESNIEAEAQKSKLCFAKAQYLAVAVDNDIDRIIQEKFQGEFLDKLKEEVLKAILQFSPEQVNCFESLQTKSKKDEEKIISSSSSQLKKLSNNCAKTICDIRKQASKVANGQAGPSLETKLDTNDSDLDLSCFSFESVSSVHTSDLSSFEDEISLSSDEESGAKSRKFSLKEIQEKLENSSTAKIENTEDKKQAETIQADDAQSGFSVNGNEISTTSQKSQRRRKPNLKYAADDIVSPFKKKSLEKVSFSSRSVCGDVSRKRGRPRKYST